MRPIKITTKEIVNRIKKLKVVKIKQLTEYIDCSAWTLFYKLKVQGYYTSYNLNRQYITLKEIPIFDSNGIWEYRGIKFSKYKNVEETIGHIINRSPAGLSASEIAETLGIQTHNQLLRCKRKGLLARKRYGRNQIYYCADEKTRKQQMEKRETKLMKLMKHPKSKPPSYKTIINILLVMLKHHEIKPDQIISILSSEEKRINEIDVKWVMKEYGI